MDDKTQAQLDNNFRYHAPKSGQAETYATVRDKAKELAEHLHNVCPASRELSVAITHLETAVFWANAAIARNG
jgi:hypothetical protein